MKTFKVTFRPWKKHAGPEMECTLAAKDSESAIKQARHLIGAGNEYRVSSVVEVPA